MEEDGELSTGELILGDHLARERDIVTSQSSEPLYERISERQEGVVPPRSVDALTLGFAHGAGPDADRHVYIIQLTSDGPDGTPETITYAFHEESLVALGSGLLELISTARKEGLAVS